ncbi:Hcy-binding domain-containing protein [Aphelenchoides besseyi]|nr:Hcy-binding domain-containing protein [Aphelenchoides besseyi]KAI6201860.1 Hcy-binding domain-containing protein [Aphelenchoides besseyi]
MTEASFFEPLNFDDQRLRILDGGMGALIEKLGFDPSKTVAWSSGANVTDPELVFKAHMAFIEAGAEVILTNTYQANIKRLAHSFSPSETLNHVRRGVELALEAAQKSGKTIRIVGSIGSYATYLADGSEYTGSYTTDPSFDLDLIYANYKTQALELFQNGVRMFAFETTPSVAEAKVARRVLEQLSSEGFDIYGWVSAQCKDYEHLANGDKFVDFVSALADSPRVRAIGINCTSPQHVGSLLRHGHTVANGKAFVVYPNSGENFNKDLKVYFGNPRTERILQEMEEWTKLGVRLIGGCCRVTPDDLKQIAKRAEELKIA